MEGICWKKKSISDSFKWGQNKYGVSKFHDFRLSIIYLERNSTSFAWVMVQTLSNDSIKFYVFFVVVIYTWLFICLFVSLFIGPCAFRISIRKNMLVYYCFKLQKKTTQKLLRSLLHLVQRTSCRTVTLRKKFCWRTGLSTKFFSGELQFCS